jgi:hypothetical protein
MIVYGPVVKRSVRLDIAHPGAGDPSEPVQCRDLINHVVGQAGRIDIDAAATEAGQVPVTNLGADGDAAAHGGLADPPHDIGVAGMEAARDIGARDHVEQGIVVAQHPDAESLAEIAVEVDDGRSTRLAHRALVG